MTPYTMNFLICVGQAGIVLNIDKFHFTKMSIDFAGFRVSDSTTEPLPKYLDAIRDFLSLRPWQRILEAALA